MSKLVGRQLVISNDAGAAWPFFRRRTGSPDEVEMILVFFRDWVIIRMLTGEVPTFI